MLGRVTHQFNTDELGNPTSGWTNSKNLSIRWDDPAVDVAIIEALIERFTYYQGTEKRDLKYKRAIGHLRGALWEIEKLEIEKEESHEV